MFYNCSCGSNGIYLATGNCCVTLGLGTGLSWTLAIDKSCGTILFVKKRPVSSFGTCCVPLGLGTGSSSSTLEWDKLCGFISSDLGLLTTGGSGGDIFRNKTKWCTSFDFFYSSNKMEILLIVV